MILVPWPVSNSVPWVEVQSLNHWTMKEVPIFKKNAIKQLNWLENRKRLSY